MSDTDAPPSAAEAIQIIEREQARTGAGLTPNLVLMLGAWGVAYLLAGVLYYLYRVDLLGGITTLVAVVLIGAVASTVSTVGVVRGMRGVRSTSGQQGAMFGFSWTISLALTGVLSVGIATVLPAGSGAVVTPALFVFVVGVLHMSSGVVWPNWPTYVGGAWTMGVAVASVFVPAPENVLVLAIGGGGGFLAVAAWFALMTRR